MEYVKIYDEVKKYDEEIGEHIDPLLPNVSYVKEDDSVRFNLNPDRWGHFSVTDVTEDNCLFYDVRGLKAIYINGSTENVCPNYISSPRSYKFELSENDVFTEAWGSYVFTPNKLFTGQNITSYIIKTHEPISLDYRVNVTFATGPSSVGTIDAPLIDMGYDLNSLINEGLATQIDEYCVDISKFMETIYFESYTNAVINLGCMLWNNANQTYITTINELYGEQKENEVIIEITAENVEDAFYGDNPIIDLMVANLTMTWETEPQNTDIVELDGNQYTWEEFVDVYSDWFFALGDTKVQHPGFQASYIPPIIVYRDGVMLNCTISGTVIDFFFPIPFEVQENGEYDVRFELKNRFSTNDIGFSSNLTQLSNQALYYCKNIFMDMFNDCYQLHEITIPNSVTSIGDEAFGSCSGLTEIVIPNSVTSIGQDIFMSCESLTSVTFGNGVTSIGKHAFYYCINLTNVTIGSGVTSIGYGAFYNCTSLTELTCYATTAPTLDSFVFRYMPTNGVLRVPSGSNYSSWLSALPSGWVIEYI